MVEVRYDSMEAQIIEVGTGWSLKNLEADPPKLYIIVNGERQFIDSSCHINTYENETRLDFKSGCLDSIAPFEMSINAGVLLDSSNLDEARPVSAEIDTSSCGSDGPVYT